jgi:pimeloyl-ACP methyl ester carboxylesterase
LPFGMIDLVLDQGALRWHGRDLVDFEPTVNLSVRGMRNLYRDPGLGEPLAALAAPEPAPAEGLQLAPRLRIPTNLLLVVDAPRRQIAQTSLQGRLAINTFFDRQDVQIGADIIPLEYDQSAAWALSLAERSVWSTEYKRFFSGPLFGPEGQLGALMPHQYGHMPVILVHGTASSPFRWADMVNDLLEDPAISGNFEFWLFAYASGNPIPYSALQLRQAIEDAVAQLGGVQADPALGEITVIGHSQGGLLAKMLVIDPGDRLWNGMGMPAFSSLRVSDASRALLRAAMFPQPVPEVRRVIFIATPQRGSFVAGFSLSRLVNRLVTLPLAVTQVGREAFGGNGTTAIVGSTRLRMGSISGMSPNSPFVRSLAAVPVVPGVHAHSIIAVNTPGPVAGGNDGVVSYASAHIEGVESELVVRSGHSTQSNPATIAEVRRILLLQLAASRNQ